MAMTQRHLASDPGVATPPLPGSPPRRLREGPLHMNDDQDTLLRAIEDAGRILGEYIQAGPRDATHPLGDLWSSSITMTVCY
jgi:hypothetical protein